MAIGDGVSAIASLAVCFGGFSPTAMDGVDATKEQLARMEVEMARKKEAARKRRELEMARTSKPAVFEDGLGGRWTYVVLDDRAVRVLRYEGSLPCVSVPDRIAELPVFAVGPEAFADNESIVEVSFGSEVEVIGAYAFRDCANLESVEFPSRVGDFPASWLARCSAIRRIVLPGALEELDSAVFDNPGLKHLVIGPNVRAVKPGSFEKSRLERIEVDPANPHLATDGVALYSRDGKVLVALARRVEELRVPDGVRKLGKKACMGADALLRVVLPESLEVLGEYAFSHAGLLEFQAPPRLRKICERAFYHASDLRRVALNEGLGEIGKAAFAESGIEALRIPSTVESVGTSLTEYTPIVYGGDAPTFSVDPASNHLFYDGEGGLYRKSQGLCFIQLMDRERERFALAEGTRAVDDYAFAYHPSIREVFIPDGVERIGDSAFRVCEKLETVRFPETLRSIGKEAFIDTRLAGIYLPACFEEMGKDALVTAGAHHVGEPPSLRDIQVSPRNPRFYVESGILCRRTEAGDRAIVFDNAVHDVRIPDGVVHIESFAFNNAFSIESMQIGPNLRTIDNAGLTTWCYIEDIRIELADPVEGRTQFRFRFPDTRRTMHEISLGLGGSSWVNVEEMWKHYDNCLANAHNYNARAEEGISSYEQARLIVERLRDPILLTRVNRSMFERTLRFHVVEICVDAARHDDRSLIDSLVEFGYLNGDNIEETIIAVGRLQDAAASGYLLELKRRRFGLEAFDFDL